jgi:chemosensory pili system protein ChpA (sensor histidine kinase/response regulator)
VKPERYAAMLAGEIERAATDLAGEAQAIVDEPDATETLAGAIDVYCASIDRTRDAAELIGLGGLAACAGIVAANVRLLEKRPTGERAAAMAHVIGWSRCFVAYLRAMDDVDVRDALVAFVADPALPQPCDTASAVSITGLLETGRVSIEALVDAEYVAAEAPLAPLTDADLSLQIPADCDARVRAAFLGEAPRQADELADLVARIVGGIASTHERHAAQRLAHSLKGSAATVGVRAIATVAHALEDVLEALADGGAAPDATTSNLLLDGSGCVAQLVQALLGNESAPTDLRALAERLREHARAMPESTAWPYGPAPVASAEADEHAGGTAQYSAAAQSADVPPSPAARAAPPAAPDNPTLRVPVGTVDEMFRLLGDLGARVGRLQAELRAASDASRTLRNALDAMEPVIAPSGDDYARRTFDEIAAAARAMEERVATLAADAVHHERIQRELGRLVVSTRMLPAATLVPRLERNLRQTCRQLDRAAELRVTGEDILLDGDVLELLADPLLHLLRNAVDHGVEAPAVRQRAGKPAAGAIDVVFARRGPVVTVTVRDDGPGLDYAAIQRRAVERGLVRADAAPTRAELARFIFASGFSTRDAVSEVSGRGIGMDVVYERLAAMKGTVDIVSEPGQGCAITLRFQATLVAQHALVVACAGQTLAVPSHLIEIALAPDMADFVIDDGHACVVYQGVVYRLLSLATLAGFGADAVGVRTAIERPLLLVRDGDRRAALACDRLLDGRELVVKRIGRWFHRVPSLAGAVILASGQVAPVVDVGELVRAQFARERALALAPERAPAFAPDRTPAAAPDRAALRDSPDPQGGGA